MLKFSFIQIGLFNVYLFYYFLGFSKKACSVCQELKRNPHAGKGWCFSTKDSAQNPHLEPQFVKLFHFNGCDGGGDRCHTHPSNCAQGLPIQTLSAIVSQELALGSDPGRLQQTLVQGTKRAWDSHDFISPREHF